MNLVASVFPLGAALGTIVLPFLIDKHGRKWTMMYLVPPFLAGWIFIIASGMMIAPLLIGRLLTGACGGMFCVVAPMYSAEIAEKEIRGTLGVFFQLFIVIGILYAFCCGYTRSIMTTSILCSLGPLLFGCIMFFIPESPLHYLAVDNEEAAKKAMRFFRGPDYDIDPELHAFKEQVQQRYKEKVTLKSFLNKPVMKVMMLAYGLMISQQLSGINAIIFYAETLFKQTGVDLDSMLQMVIFAVFQVFACVASALLIDQVGRKILMAVSVGTMCVCLVCLVIFFVLKNTDPSKADSIFWLPLASACTYIVAFCLGAGPIPWLYMGEIFPPKLKSVASSSAVFLNWLLAFMVTVSFSSVVDAIGNAGIFSIFAVICGLSTVFVMVFMIETKGKTFADIQRQSGTFTIRLPSP
ncbi:hdc homolog, cell cycle regulator isoform X2 [Ptiloglossa arizonensis]|uniref:hdc homolog, cell cycle regulator isoform X2 n=1 Tax=Ptiloglossa arizonensis TaxID=3350558 RepID=UPI003FA0D153